MVYKRHFQLGSDREQNDGFCTVCSWYNVERIGVNSQNTDMIRLTAAIEDDITPEHVLNNKISNPDNSGRNTFAELDSCQMTKKKGLCPMIQTSQNPSNKTVAISLVEYSLDMREVMS